MYSDQVVAKAKVGYSRLDIATSTGRYLLNRSYNLRSLNIGLRKNRSLTSLYDSWYVTPWECLYENIGKNHKSYQIQEDKLFTSASNSFENEISIQ